MPTTTVRLAAKPDVAEMDVVEPTQTTTINPAPIVVGPQIKTRIAITPGNAQPRYPLHARKRGYEGRTVVRVAVSEDGKVAATKIAQSSGYKVLDVAAREAVAAWQFKPATRGGYPVTGRIDVPVEFRLR